jgi:two-component system, OmpR family, KDP operon response regulator KdpE
MLRDSSAASAGAPVRPPRPTTILVIEDEPEVRRVVRAALEGDATSVFEASTGVGGEALVAAEHPDLIVLDHGLPDSDGVDLCRALRSRTAAPIVVLSARHSETQKVALLDAGADDYVTKPFSADELRARVRAQLRRASGVLRPLAHTPRTFGHVTLDFDVPLATRAGQSVHLTPTEWELLRALVDREGRTVTHAHLFRSVWGNASGDAQQYLRVYIRSLRRKLEADPIRPRLIVTEAGVGYRLEHATEA